MCACVQVYACLCACVGIKLIEPSRTQPRRSRHMIEWGPASSVRCVLSSHLSQQSAGRLMRSKGDRETKCVVNHNHLGLLLRTIGKRKTVDLIAEVDQNLVLKQRQKVGWDDIRSVLLKPYVAKHNSRLIEIVEKAIRG